MQHISTSSYHKLSKLSSKNLSSLHDRSVASRWTIFRPSKYLLALSMLREKVHSINILSRYGYPIGDSARQPNRQPTPLTIHGESRCDAVALDCEMVATIQNRNELARLTAIDYLTGQILMDTLIDPVKLEEWAKRKANTLSPKALKRNTNQRIAKHHSLQRATEDKRDDDDDALFWSDVAEDFGWPHPDTGYDPWSD